jgi:uncharacterized surface protein with fasciclin (FAS1) repeats
MKRIPKINVLIAVALTIVGSSAVPAYGEECASKAKATKTESAATKSEAKNIVETAVGAGSFGTLVAAVKAAGLVETLSGEGPFTVFAPTDEAFAALPEGTVESLLKPENKEKLIAILTYHVVPGKLMAADVLDAKKAKTVQGNSVKVTTEKNESGATSVLVDGAKVTATDILASNGVIHVIDKVILPN